jgi:hypothetical protein
MATLEKTKRYIADFSWSLPDHFRANNFFTATFELCRFEDDHLATLCSDPSLPQPVTAIGSDNEPFSDSILSCVCGKILFCENIIIRIILHSLPVSY